LTGLTLKVYKIKGGVKVSEIIKEVRRKGILSPSIIDLIIKII
jgi:hypothetical protein